MSTVVRVVALGGVLVPLVVVAVTASRWSHPTGDAPTRFLAAVVWGTSTLVVASVALGAIGRFRLVPLVFLLAVLAVGSLALAPGGERSGTSRVVSGGGARSAVVGGTVGLVVVQWLRAAARGVQVGMIDPDSQHYHLSQAARFVQTGEVFPVHRVSAGDLAAFHPNNDELLRAVGLLATRSEASGLVWVAITFVLSLLAAHVVGRQSGRAGALVAGTAAVLALPGAARSYAGSAANDWAAVALLMAAVALWAVARSPRMLAPAGLAAGLALGTKLSVLGAVGAFALMALLLSHQVDRGRRAIVLGSGMLATGGWWFLRNALAVGTPVPGMGIPLLDDPAAPLLDRGAFSVLHYATDIDVVRDWYLPGLAWSLGPLWWLVLVVVVAGIVLGVRRSTSETVPVAAVPRLLAVVAAVALVAYLLTPTGAAGTPGEPVLFQFNVRYLLPSVLASVWVLALRLPVWVTVAGAATIVVVTLAPSSSWAGRGPAWAAMALLAVVVGAVLAARVRVRPSPVVALGLLAVGVVAGPVATQLDQNRYRGSDARSTVLAVGRDLDDGDVVGVVGFPLQYAFTGPDQRTRVEYVGTLRDDGAFVDHGTCATFLEAVREHDYTYVAVLRFDGQPMPDATAWLERVEAARIVAQSEVGIVYRLGGAVDAGACDGG